jgi:hypothetical protein
VSETLSVGAGFIPAHDPEFIPARKGQPATSPSVVSTGLKNSGSNDSLRQAQGLSLSKAAGQNGRTNHSTQMLKIFSFAMEWCFLLEDAF